MENKAKLYRKLFFSTLQLSAFTFGGGFVIIPLMRKKFVLQLKWIDEHEMMDMTAIAQSSPGAIAVNASILVGYHVAGLAGALFTVLGTVIPPLVILSVISFFYVAFRDNMIVNMAMKGMQAGVAAVIFDVVLTMGGSVVSTKKLIPIIMLAGSFIAAYFFKVNVILILLVCGIVGAVYTLHGKPAGKEQDHDLS